MYAFILYYGKNTLNVITKKINVWILFHSCSAKRYICRIENEVNLYTYKTNDILQVK